MRFAIPCVVRLLPLAALLSALALVALPAASAEEEPAEEYRIIDVAADFLAYHEAAKDLDGKTRRARWDEMLEARHPAIFENLIYRKKEGQAREVYKADCIRRFWEEVAPRMDHVARVHRGKVVDIDGRNVMALGLETFREEGAQIEITIAHELLHLHHFRFFSPKGALYRTLWTEGLATYASAVLVPGHRMSTVLGFPGEKVDRCGELLPALAADLRKHMGERDERLSRIYFGAEPNDTRVPPEAGYYVGLMIVKRLAEETPLGELLRWEKDRVFRVLSEELRRLE
jgi:hypothetical protein